MNSLKPRPKRPSESSWMLNNWWPKEYTWSQEMLQEIRIDRKTGRCTEIGPHDFRCDWGRVTRQLENESIWIKRQIGPSREPVPNKEKASDLKISFLPHLDGTTLLLEHENFGRHGIGGKQYQKMMDSPQGWDYILKCFKKYCET